MLHCNGKRSSYYNTLQKNITILLSFTIHKRPCWVTMIKKSNAKTTLPWSTFPREDKQIKSPRKDKTKKNKQFHGNKRINKGTRVTLMLKTTIKEDEARTQERQRSGIIRSPPRRCHVGQKRRATRSAGRGRSHRFPILLPLWSPGLLCRPFLLSLPLSPWSLTRGLSPNSSGLLSWLYVEEDTSVFYFLIP